MEKIDLVVTYLNEKDEKWQKNFLYYKNKEIKLKIADAENKQAFGKERIRDWQAMKYWFRGVEKNCPWINKIFFIVQNKRHIPEWLNINHPKLKIIYHKDYIPRELLPTFNTMVIQAFIPLIKGLSDFYIISDDDCFFLNEIFPDMFVQRNRPVLIAKPFWGEGMYYPDMGPWGHNLDNNYNIEKKYNGVPYKYGISHLPNAYSLPIVKQILQDNYDIIYNSLKVSKFRNPKNISPNELYSNITKRLNKAIINKDMYKDSAYVTLKRNLDYKKYQKKNLVCFNDTEDLEHEDFPETKMQLLNFMEERLPNMSNFEKCDFDVTLIVPCHNLEKWIKPCLTSIKNQDNTQKIKRQVIFICDNCTDNTKNIIKQNMRRCHTWSWRVIDAHEGSPGGARNKGLEMASSKYIWFIDGDDYITCNNAIDELYRLMNKDDMDIIEFKIKSNANPEGAFGGGTVWRCMLSSRIIGETRFNDRQNGEDNDFIWDIYHKPNAKYGKIALAPYFYNYPREGSQMWKKEKGLIT